MTSFRLKVRNGFLWAALGAFAGRGLQFVTEIILSRILFPEDFGLMAVGLAVLNISEMLTETGFSSALIQKQGDIKRYLNTAWTMEVIKSILLFLIVFIMSKPIAAFYDNLSAINILQAISILFLLRGFRNVGIVFFRKNLEIHKQVILDTIPFIIQLSFVVILASFIQNVWLIVYGIYSRRLAELGLSYLMHRHRPKFEFNQNSFKELFHFGKWIFSISIIGAIGKNFVPLFIGKYFDIETLGYFNRAELFSILLFAVLIQIIWQVGYPAMSHLQDNKEKLKNLYFKLFYLIIIIGLPITTIIFIYSNEILTTILSEKWLGSTQMLKLLVFAGFLSLIGTLSPMFLQAIGCPKISAKISMISLIILMVLIVPLSNYFNVIGLIYSMIISRVYYFFHGFIFFYKYQNK